MMKKTLTLLTFVLSQPGHTQEIADKGYRLSGEAVMKDFTLMRLTPSEDHLIKYILKTNHRVPREEAVAIASNVLKVSECLKIDPWLLTGLIQKESTFKRDAVSPTNAAGLTQFTSVGFKEVNDQLGIRGKEGATENAILYYSSKIRDCIDPGWVDLWNRVSATPEDPDFFNLLKEEIKTDIPTAVTYGAILLKTYVAYVDNRSARAEVDLPLSETYYQALQIYNGEEGNAKVNYAKAIFKNVQNLYPHKVNFPFLQQ
nr:transglycosylase SLT domain-containing protein [Bacteriovorax sp. HI3]